MASNSKNKEVLPTRRAVAKRLFELAETPVLVRRNDILRIKQRQSRPNELFGCRSEAIAALRLL